MHRGVSLSETSHRRVSVERLREAVRRAVADTSSHQVADEIGLSQSWVRKFLGGSEPHLGTLELLDTWYVQFRRERAHRALEVLLEDYPAEARRQVRDGLLDTLTKAHRRLGATLPGWLADG